MRSVVRNIRLPILTFSASTSERLGRPKRCVLVRRGPPGEPGLPLRAPEKLPHGVPRWTHRACGTRFSTSRIVLSRPRSWEALSLISHVLACQPSLRKEAERPPLPEKSSKHRGRARAAGSADLTRGPRPGARARSRSCARPAACPRAAGRRWPAAAAGRGPGRPSAASPSSPSRSA